MRSVNAVWLLALSMAPTLALAHPSGGPAVAWPLAPRGVGVLADQSFPFTWTDTNLFTPTGTITIDWFYTASMPPTFQIGATPPDLEGTVIVRGVPETDPANRWVWNTATVAAGSYFLWSRVNDLPTEVSSIRINAFSPGVVTVAHPGDPVHPAIFLPQPDSPFTFADQSFKVEWQAFDPDGTATIRLELMRSRDVAGAILLAEGLVATATGSFVVDTRAEPEGDLIFRATIQDARGLSFVSYPRYLLRVLHDPMPLDASVQDAHPADRGVLDARSMDAADAGLSLGGDAAATSSGCSCGAVGTADRGLALLFGALVWLGRVGRARTGLAGLRAPQR